MRIAEVVDRKLIRNVAISGWSRELIPDLVALVVATVPTLLLPHVAFAPKLSPSPPIVQERSH